jgi:tRNA pseudouridine38-40 synthase
VRGRLRTREARLPRTALTPLYRVTLAYDGTEFLGWQAQERPDGTRPRTVQGDLEAALTLLASGAPVRVSGAGRTDAGVHALGQVASFELPRAIAPDALQRSLNGMLRDDLRVVEASEAPPGFHARKSARGKLYRYEVDSGAFQLPTRRRMAAHVRWPLDSPAVQDAAALFVGRHDFAAVASTGSSVRTTVRTVTRSEAVLHGSTLVYEVEADGFLRKMVRSIVGGLIAAGRGVATIDDLGRALAAGDRSAWPAPAEARGLTLVRVRY